MKLLHKVISFAVFTMMLCSGSAALAKTILYVPQDNRPVDFAYTVNTAQDAGYTIITPPQKYLSSSNFKGSPEQLLQWVDAHAGEADAMVLSVDSLVYGGLVDSRKHNLDMAQMALAFVNTRAFVTANIIGATSLEQLKSNIDSINLSLSDAVLEDIEAVQSRFPNPAP